jgi:hypothetical protein
MMVARTTIAALVLAIAATPSVAVADHRVEDERPPTPFADFAERAYAQVGYWDEDPMLEIRQSHGGLAAYSLAAELQYIVPEPCYLGAYGGYWGLVPKLLVISQAADTAMFDLARARFREELARTLERVDHDGGVCSAWESGSEPANVERSSPARYDHVIELEASAALQFLDETGERVTAISVIPGQTVLIRVDNTAGFDHSFWIGTEEQLHEPMGVTDIGIPMWTSGTRELMWTVPEDVSGVMFGCTVPGHFELMHGDIVVAR